MLHQFRRPLTRDAAFLLSGTLGWLGFCVLREPEMSIQRGFLLALWATAAALLAMTLLYWVEFFKPFRLVKILPDTIGIAIALLAGGFAAKPLIGGLLSLEIPRYRDMLYGLWLPTAAVLLQETFAQWIRSRSSVKSTVYLTLTDEEESAFIATFENGRWRQYFRILSPQEFSGALASGGRVDYVVVSRDATIGLLSNQNLMHANASGIRILDYRTLMNQISGRLPLSETDLWSFLAGSERQNFVHWAYRVGKFYLEPLMAAVLLVLLSPLFVVTALAIRLTSPGPVFFRQRRTGQLGIDFELVKFRSMRIDAERDGAQWATESDDRVTAIGRLLRKTRLDELPQLWNVLRGEMGFMGPRPERPEFYKVIEEQVPQFKLRLLARPGITGWAQLLGGYAASIDESREKLEYDLYYMQYMSPRMDLIVLWKTFVLLLGGRSGR